ncbi:hypothetical protein F3Y22_tig00110198pilonHSYRG00038 [Hibiscus syriacus]|uniref:Uncharacterized protein n=1 Tax=Hibiscus syriacus TaxID=106335 RepID=A0A6A3BDW9_HIBSY|nr:hypothetical protein F3Y22_tig00110198pilonHSYRG00038 [Hibiscus syriacus]
MEPQQLQCSFFLSSQSRSHPFSPQGVQYYIVSAISGPSGAVLDIGWSSKPCPESGVPIRFGGYGTPVMFSNANPVMDCPPILDVNIEFIPLREKICQTSTVVDAHRLRRFDRKMYCPSVGDSCPTLCNEISRYWMHMDIYVWLSPLAKDGHLCFPKAEEATEGIQQAVRA